MRAPIFSLCLAGTCAVVSLCSCGDSEVATPTAPAEITPGMPPKQKAISLSTRQERPPGTLFHNSATLTMADAHMQERAGEVTTNGKATMVVRQMWDLIEISPNESEFSIRELSMVYESKIDGQSKRERTESTLEGIGFKVSRQGESSPWQLTLPENKLTPLQDVEVKMLGNLWDKGRGSIYPDEPLPIGAEWNPDPKAFGMIVSPRLEVEDGEVTCRLEEVTVLRGERCAAIAVDIDLSGRILLSENASLDVQIALTGTINRSLYKFYDLRTELKGSMQMEMEFPDQGKTISVDGVTEFLQIGNVAPPEALERLQESEESAGNE